MLRRVSGVLLPGIICLSALATAIPAASAFEIFGLKLWGSSEDEDPDIVDPLRYDATLTAPEADDALKTRLERASGLISDEKRPVSGSLGLIAKARGDRERLVAALYALARYDGVVDILIDGQSIDDLAPDAEFKNQPVPVTITVDPGSVYVLGKVALKGDAAGLLPEEFGLIEGGDAGSTAVLRAEAKVVRKLKEGGHPLAAVTSREVVADHDADTLDVALTVAAGPVAAYGETTVEGTVDVDRDFTAYMTGLPRGQTYSPQEVDEARERLQALAVFNSVTVKEATALDAEGNIPIAVEVSERKKRYFGAGATISNTDGLGLEGYWGHRNLFGKAEKLRIEGSISGIGANGVDDEERNDNAVGLVKNLNYNAGIMFEKPGVIGPNSRFFANTKLIFEHPDAYDRFSIKASAGVAYDLTRNQTVSAELAVEYAKISDAFSPDRKFLIVSTPLQYVYDRRDSKLDPKSGFRLLAFAEPSYDALGNVPFLKLRGEGSVYQSIDMDGKYVFAARLVAATIAGADVAQIPADRRFYAGGGGSVRGYAYQGIGPKNPDGQPTGGLSLLETSAEMRVAVTENFGIVPFLDAGTVSTKAFPDFSEFKVGAGVGIRYLTPFGPLRIDGAIPLNPGLDDPDFGIYAGIGQAF